MKKIMFISSSGGHLSELLQMKDIFKNYDYHIVTEKTKSTSKLVDDYNKKVSFLLYGTKDHLFKYIFILLFNCFISLYYLIRYNPSIVVTTGAHTAGPMCCLAKLFFKKIIYIETYANSETKTATGKLLYFIADEFIVQWESMLKVYPKAKYIGSVY